MKTLILGTLCFFVCIISLHAQLHIEGAINSPLGTNRISIGQGIGGQQKLLVHSSIPANHAIVGSVDNTNAIAVFGLANHANGIASAGVKGISLKGVGVYGVSTDGWAGKFDGNVSSSGILMLEGDLMGNRTDEAFSIFSRTHQSEGAYLRLYDNDHNSFSGSMSLVAGGDGAINFFNFAGSVNSPVWQQNMSIQSDGKVVIGDQNTTFQNPNFRLFVRDGIMTEEVMVALFGSNEWPDYVFQPEYERLPLSCVKETTETQQHLPGMPSAAQLTEEGGISLKKMTILQQEKIEELFLYIIELEERIRQLEQITE
ncbi:MAG: hypothetical protein AAF206_21640 [Bacteroidota bacterium]